MIGLALLSTFGQGIRYLSLSRQDQALTTLLETNCQRTFQSARLSTCRAEVQRRLGASATGTGAGAERGFLVTLAAVADARGGGSQIEALSFRNGVMDLRVLAPSVPVLDEFARNLGSNGDFQANITSANPSDAGVEGRLQIVGLP